MIANIFRTASRTLSACTLMRASCAAALALAVGGADGAQASPAAQAGQCRVEFTGLSDVVYNPALELSGLLIQGNHNYASDTRVGGSDSTAFEVLDPDGFLILYVLLNEWRISGQLDQNATRAVRFERSDLALALEAAEMGLNYQQVLTAKVEQERLDNSADILRLLAMKTEGMRLIIEGLRPLLGSGTGPVELPAGFLGVRMARFLDQLAPPGQTIMAQYLDRSTGRAPNVLCDPAAASVIVGQILCGYRFANGQAREPAVCPQGLRLNRLALQPRCRRVGGQDVC
jgi:hypothetical protein